MQHPVGYAIRGGRAVMVDFGALLKNPQLWFEFGHVILNAIMMGGVIFAGLTAFQLLKKREISNEARTIYKKTMRLSLWMSLIFAIFGLVLGDMQMQYLVKEQPMKFAATEDVYTTTGEHAPWTIVGIANTKEHKVQNNIDIPDMLSILSYHKTTGAVTGMNELNAQYKKKYGKNIDYYPPVNTLFYSFRIMCAISAWIILVSFVGLIMSRKKSGYLYKHKWTLWILALTTFLPFIGNTAGWFVTEFGRVPWTVYGLFTIQQSVSPNVSVASLLTSNIVYFVLFTALAITLIGLIVHELKKDPTQTIEPKFKKVLDPFDKEAF